MHLHVEATPLCACNYTQGAWKKEFLRTMQHDEHTCTTRWEYSLHGMAKLQQQLLAVLHTTASCKYKHGNGN
jgi:hypothetical protein